MPVSVASGDTWGISGPIFLVLLIAAFVLAMVLSSALRSLATRGRPGPCDLHPCELAYLVGGRDRAVAASLVALRAGQVIEAVDKGEIRVVGEPRMSMTPLDQAILHALGQGMNTHVRTIPLHPAVRNELDALRDRLEAAGLAASADERRRARLMGMVPLLAVLVVAVVRLAAGLSGGKPATYLVMSLIVTGIITLTRLQVPEATRVGKRAMDDARVRNRVLTPSMSPSWATYGPSGAAFGVALFGSAALVSLDPQFASASEISRHLGMATSGGSSSCGGGGCGGGSSCGGGCGGGCGG